MRIVGSVSLLTVAMMLAPVAGGEKGKLDPAKLLGTWIYVSGESDGKKIDAKMLEKGTVEFTKDKITLTSPEGKFVIGYDLNVKPTPAVITMEILDGPQGKGAKGGGIIAMKDGQIQLCYNKTGPAPATFQTKAGSGFHLFTLKKKLP